MAACGDIEFEIDEVSKPDSNNSSSHNVTHLSQCYTMLHKVTQCYTMLHNVTHSENDQNNLRSYISD